MLEALGDRVQDWSLFNEPSIFSSRGYLSGRYAPGRQSLRDYLRAVHVIALAHADGWREAKAVRLRASRVSAFAISPSQPAPAHAAARERALAGLLWPQQVPHLLEAVAAAPAATGRAR